MPRAAKPPKHAHAVLDRLRALTGMNDHQLSTVLGIEPTAMGAYRRHGWLPLRPIIRAVIRGDLCVDLHWLLTGYRAPTARLPDGAKFSPLHPFADEGVLPSPAPQPPVQRPLTVADHDARRLRCDR